METVKELVLVVATFLSAVAAVLAWIAKLRWSREFSKAKEAQIEALKAEGSALKAQMETLRELSAPRLLEHYAGARAIYEQVTNQLNQQLDAGRNELRMRDDRIEELTRLRHADVEELTHLRRERQVLGANLAIAQAKVEETMAAALLGRLDSSLIDETERASQGLANSLTPNSVTVSSEMFGELKRRIILGNVTLPGLRVMGQLKHASPPEPREGPSGNEDDG